jgi:hypothetical protein
MSLQSGAAAPPSVAPRKASEGVIPISHTGSAMQKGIHQVKVDPGLLSLAKATVTPASGSRRALG